MKSLLHFDQMITPKIITFIYWLLLAAALFAGIGAMFSTGRFSFGGFFGGLFVMAGGALGARVWCELLIVLFKINENIQKIASGGR
ncbi:MAG TPA: DUF4282 domain-containing protein [Burkholderiaceae bacterium]|nr:DUF4282 domain-containing protein [Burkholderiaceae bacterium]HMZ00959.1 DUF4282 domain-containing protein [Burkholderiaceae bacterium]HNB44478.1 DUF4282 domain-containing protein [Burkholderiaceae bacterium]HNG80226.1 DUF4282 domain-containing protein [Burkholderiaceae bacterium]